MRVNSRHRGRAAVVLAVAAVVGLCASSAASASIMATTAPRTPAATLSSIGAERFVDRATALVKAMPVPEQASTVVMGHVVGTDPGALRAYMESGLGGFILMGANIPASEAELRALTAALTVDPTLPPLIAVDQEGGLVSRLNGDDHAASTSLKGLPVSETSAAFAARGSLVARAGITVNFGTVADYTADPGSFIHGRALGIDPAGAAERVAAATGAQEQFLASTLKHFPGHGAAPGDSHHAIPSTTMGLEEWRATAAVPFAAGIDAGASLLMYGHLAYTAVDTLPASLSPTWHEIARDELGFTGVAVTDDLGMLLSSGDPAYADPVANGVAAIAAGNDLVLMVAGSDAQTAGSMVHGITAAVETGTLSPERLEEAATRVVALRLQLSAATASWTVCDDCDPVD
ncbi:glycoside hydrolase family 3 N-terminal domain-containing protein [Microbacterium maritypicum]|uniref:Glycoside hydrolase family 3 N-terminal domain-containing protein n=1 Tax=Microbacterium maritypicum TaxID=33918 RepID=A0AAJ6ASF4_MICMQ|nr:glycoside hydrolase family 3 N-terminal domain-containing protein [Microbacterium liquefaciens]WEF22421.1 glycoside hydrolase family 3 N-terminal domain-containing protein [Microbacterium liquefaciens]